MSTGQRHKYEYQVNPDTAAAKVIRMVGSGQRVLELGCGPGSITRHLQANGCRVTALELDPAAIDIVSKFCDKVYPCNLNDADWPTLLGSERFPVIVAADVLEHLYDPWNTLKKLRSLLEDGGYVVISLPHIAHSAVVACLLIEDFEYQPWGLLDRTHIRFWGIRNIQKLFADAGFKIVEVEFVVRPPEQTEFASRWRKLPSEVRKALAWNRFGNVYQIVVKAVPQENGDRGLQLESLHVPVTGAGGVGADTRRNRLAAFLLSFLSLETRARISRLLRRFGIHY